MADNNRYDIYVHATGAEGGTSVVSGQTSASGDAEKTTQTATGAEKMIRGMVSYGAARTFANTLISYEISQVSLRTGAVEYEQKLQFLYEVGNKVLNIGTATVAGAKMGSAGGPIGAAIGAAIGFIGSTVYTAIGYAQNANTIATKRNEENQSIYYAALRAGVSGRRGQTQ